MEKFGELIAVLLEHSSQRFIDFWNLQLVIALGILGFSLANPQIVYKVRVRVLISLVFVAIAGFGLFSLSAHQERAEKLWAAIEARVAAAPGELLPEEVAYIDSLKPTPFSIKAGALVAADMIVILVIWFIPLFKDDEEAEGISRRGRRASRNDGARR
jgi:uncharacterized membrane protein